MPRNHPAPLAICPEQKPDEDDHEVILAYDVPNDRYFVACLTCGCEGMRCADERNAKGKWTQREGLSRKG